jgi:spore coat polysaccharide biosynthesis protein SpsF
MKLGIIIQSRMGSTRFPGKSLRPLFGRLTLIEKIVEQSGLISQGQLPVIVAIPSTKSDDRLEQLLKQKTNVDLYRGSETDVLSRYVDAADKFNLSHVVRICGDNPFIVPELCSEQMERLKKEPDLDYISYLTSDGTPAVKTHYGIFVEIISKAALDRISAKASGRSTHREHVTSFVYNNSHLFNIAYLQIPEAIQALGEFRLTIDTKTDYDIIRSIAGENNSVVKSVNDLINLVKKGSHLLSAMQETARINPK